MSIVIPASQLQHTIVTVRCENSRSAPQIECAFDDQAPPGLASHEDKGASFSFSPRRAPSALTSPGQSTIEGGLGMPRADLSIERGMDHRGHFVRMSFSPAPCLSSPPGRRRDSKQGQGQPKVNYYPNIERQTTPRQETPRETTPRQPTPRPEVQQKQKQSDGVFDLIPAAQTTNNMFDPTASDENPIDFGSMDFSLPTDADLMSALESTLNGYDYSQSLDYLMTQASEGMLPNFDTSLQLGSTSVPPTPELTSSSSSSSSFGSPPTPYDFSLPSTSTSSACGSVSGSLGSSSSLQGSPATSHEPSPMLPPGSLPQGLGLKTQGLPSSSESRLLPCPHPGCKRHFKNTSTLTGHLKTHAGKGARFACSYPPCTEKFSRRHDQLRHEVYKHGKRCEWVCHRCNSFFSYERSLEKHTCTMDKSRRGSVPYGADTPGGVSTGAKPGK